MQKQSTSTCQVHLRFFGAVFFGEMGKKDDGHQKVTTGKQKHSNNRPELTGLQLALSFMCVTLLVMYKMEAAWTVHITQGFLWAILTPFVSFPSSFPRPP